MGAIYNLEVTSYDQILTYSPGDFLDWAGTVLILAIVAAASEHDTHIDSFCTVRQSIVMNDINLCCPDSLVTHWHDTR